MPPPPRRALAAEPSVQTGWKLIVPEIGEAPPRWLAVTVTVCANATTGSHKSAKASFCSVFIFTLSVHLLDSAVFCEDELKVSALAGAERAKSFSYSAVYPSGA